MVRATEWGEGFGVDDEGDIRPVDDFEQDSAPGEPDSEEHLVERLEDLSDDDFVHFGANAVRSLEVERHQYPPSVQEVIAGRKEKAARSIQHVEREDAYAELGGGVRRVEQPTRDEVLENVLGEYEPWQTDIKEAVERFGVVEFMAQQFAGMPDKERRVFSLHFYRFLESIDAAARLISDMNGRTNVPLREIPFLNDRYRGATWEQLFKYKNTLAWLKKDLEATGIPRVVRSELQTNVNITPGGDVEEVRDTARRRAESELSVYKTRHAKRPQIQVIEGKAGPRIETVK